MRHSFLQMTVNVHEMTGIYWLGIRRDRVATERRRVSGRQREMSGTLACLWSCHRSSRSCNDPTKKGTTEAT
jgi:hypothetical protein